jgi:putative salt-induced outer membrane protein YdiY
MRRLLAAFCLLAGLAPAQDSPPAQDSIRLKNGDVLTGTLESMTDGKITFDSGMIGAVTVPLDNVQDVRTSSPVKVVTKTGEVVSRRIDGIDGGDLLLSSVDGGLPGGRLPLGSVKALNPPDVKWTGALTAGGYLNTGNTERRAASANFDAERRSEIDRFSVKAMWNYAEDKVAIGQWNLSQRRTFGALKYDYFLTEKLYLTANTSFEGDLQANLRLRFTAGAGLGYQVVERDDLAFAVEAGLAYLSETYRDTTPDSDTVAARGAWDLRYQLTEAVRFLQTVEAFVGLEDVEDVLIRKDSRVQVQLTDSMVSGLQWLLTYDATPAMNRDRMDHMFTATVGWTF